MIISLLALVAAQSAPSPAAVAAPCELKGVSAVDLVALRVAILDQATNGTPKPATAQATMQAIEANAATCQEGSDPKADRAAVEVASARLSADTVAEKLAADGVDMTKVAAEVEKTDKPILEALVARKMDAEGVDDLRKRVTAAAGDAPGEETERLLGFYAFNTARVAVGVPAPIVVSPAADTPKPAKPVER